MAGLVSLGTKVVDKAVEAVTEGFSVVRRLLLRLGLRGLCGRDLGETSEDVLTTKYPLSVPIPLRELFLAT